MVLLTSVTSVIPLYSLKFWFLFHKTNYHPHLADISLEDSALLTVCYLASFKVYFDNTEWLVVS